MFAKVKPTKIDPDIHITRDFWLRPENLKLLLESIHENRGSVPREKNWTLVSHVRGTPFIPMGRYSE